MSEVVTNFDKYMNKQFKKHCPDAAKFLNSRNPIAKKHAEEDRFFFTVGMLVHNDFSDDDQIEWDLAFAADYCPRCQEFDPNDPCDTDPMVCEIFHSIVSQQLRSTKSDSKRMEVKP